MRRNHTSRLIALFMSVLMLLGCVVPLSAAEEKTSSLATTTLKEISDRLNFPDQSGFGRFFRSNTGKSPKEFRQELYDQEGSSLP